MFTFQVFVKKVNQLTCFDDWSHQSQNFTVSKTVVHVSREFYSTCASLTRAAFLEAMHFRNASQFLAYVV